MKTKELVRQLQKEDPSGELEVCVDNIDILHVSREPAYYDGCQEILIRDVNTKCYDIVGVKITSKGTKIKIHPLSIEDAIFEDPGLPVEIDTDFTNEESNQWRRNNVKKWRQEAIKVLEEIENESSGPKDEYMLKRIEAGKKKLEEE